MVEVVNPNAAAIIAEREKIPKVVKVPEDVPAEHVSELYPPVDIEQIENSYKDVRGKEVGHGI